MKFKRSSVLRQPPISFASNDSHDFSIISHIRIIIFSLLVLSPSSWMHRSFVYFRTRWTLKSGRLDRRKKRTHTQIGMQRSRKQTTGHNGKWVYVCVCVFAHDALNMCFCESNNVFIELWIRKNQQRIALLGTFVE